MTAAPEEWDHGHAIDHEGLQKKESKHTILTPCRPVKKRKEHEETWMPAKMGGADPTTSTTGAKIESICLTRRSTAPFSSGWCLIRWSLQHEEANKRLQIVQKLSSTAFWLNWVCTSAVTLLRPRLPPVTTFWSWKKYTNSCQYYKPNHTYHCYGKGIHFLPCKLCSSADCASTSCHCNFRRISPIVPAKCSFWEG